MTIRSLFTVFAIAALSLSANGSAFAEDEPVCGMDLTNAVPSAVVNGEISSVGFIAGVRWGHGYLTLPNGTKRPFNIIGGKLLETGIADNVFTGEVFNLVSTDDFEGTYYGAGAKLTIAKGAGESVVNNKRCVVIKARAVGHGLQLSAPGPSGVEISFTD